MTRLAVLAPSVAAAALLSIADRADAAEGYGWLWAHDSTATYEYVPSTTYQFNWHGDNTVLRQSVGRYSVYLPGLGGADGNVQVTAYGTDSHHCKVGSWGGVSEQTVDVRCFDSAGAPVDARFTVLFQSHSDFSPYSDGAAAYLWANNPTSPSYTPSTTYQFNSEGLSNTITRSGPGVYDVRVAGIDAIGGTALVTAYGSSSHRCKVGYWGQSGADTVVRVYCHDTNGARVDSMFTFSFANDTGLSYAGADYGSDAGAFTWTGGSTAGTIALPTAYSYHPPYLTGSVGTRTRNATGRYTVRFDGLEWWPGASTLALVTAYGSDASQCKVEGWYSSGGDAVVNVRCTNTAGVLVDSFFTLTFQTDMEPLI
jgi:hypothetical protein